MKREVDIKKPFAGLTPDQRCLVAKQIEKTAKTPMFSERDMEIMYAAETGLTSKLPSISEKISDKQICEIVKHVLEHTGKMLEEVGGIGGFKAHRDPSPNFQMINSGKALQGIAKVQDCSLYEGGGSRGEGSWHDTGGGISISNSSSECTQVCTAGQCYDVGSCGSDTGGGGSGGDCMIM